MAFNKRLACMALPAIALVIGVILVLQDARVDVAFSTVPDHAPTESGDGASCVISETVSCQLAEEPFPSVASEQVSWALRNHRPAMVLFYSTLCRPCMMMDALMQMVKRDYEPHVVFIEVLYDDPANAELLRWAKVGGIPTSYFLSASGEGKRIVGVMKQAVLRDELARLVEGETLTPAPTGLGVR